MPRMKRRPPIGEIDEDGITYDKLDRMNYHPDFHPNHGKHFSLSERIYVCKFHGIDDLRSLSFAIGKTEHAIATQISSLRQAGLYEKYKAMPFEQWAKILEGAERFEQVEQVGNRSYRECIV